ncbi:MAG: hypothetical protein AAF368_05090 [Planctomycetota bacterium]
MRQLSPTASLVLLIAACSPNGGTVDADPSSSAGAATVESQATGDLDYDGLFPWAFETAHEMAARLEVEGDWSELALLRFLQAEPTTELSRLVFINRSTVRMEDGHVKYAILRFDLGESSLVNIVTSDKGLLINDDRDWEEFERTVNDFANFEGLLPSKAIAIARAHVAAEHGLQSDAQLPLVRFELDYFARPQCMELAFQLSPQALDWITVRLDPAGNVLAD